MRVLHLIDSGGLYGAEIVVLNLMEAQKKMGFHPMLLSMGDIEGPKDIEIDAQRRGLDCITLRFGKRLLINGSKKILYHTKVLGSHIIHSHGYKGNILLSMLPRALCNFATVTTLHGWTSKHAFTKISIYKYLDALAIMRFDAAIAVSSNLLKHPLLRLLGIRPIVINNGIPRLNFQTNSFQKECTEIAGRCESKFSILSIGRLSPEKGFDILIQAMAKTVSHGYDFSLVVVGDGQDRPLLAHLAEKENISDRVHLVGYRDKAFRYIPCFDVGGDF